MSTPASTTTLDNCPRPANDPAAEKDENPAAPAHNLRSPASHESPITHEQASRTLRDLTTSHYENFSVLSRLVPKDLRDDFAAVYAFCRCSDDLADETGAGPKARTQSLDLLARWRQQLIGCFNSVDLESSPPPLLHTGAPRPATPNSNRDSHSDEPTHPVFIALAATARKHALDPAPFHHLLDAFEDDQRIHQHEHWDSLINYCKGSANPVGRIVLALAGVDPRLDRNKNVTRMSDATCTALQLTNFWQDVQRDLLERDRVYLPRQETSLDAPALRDMLTRAHDPEARIAYIYALRPLVVRTRQLFQEGRPLSRSLDARIGPVIWLFGAGGESVLTSIERIGCTTLWKRPRLTRSRKLALIAQASLLRARNRRNSA